MIVSNEPGYYEAGWGGVRLENLYVVAPDEEMPGHPDGRKWLRMESLTLIPFDKTLINWDQLSGGEREWLEGYHRQVWDTIAPMLGEADREVVTGGLPDPLTGGASQPEPVQPEPARSPRAGISQMAGYPVSLRRSGGAPNKPSAVWHSWHRKARH